MITTKIVCDICGREIKYRNNAYVFSFKENKNVDDFDICKSCFKWMKGCKENIAIEKKTAL